MAKIRQKPSSERPKRKRVSRTLRLVAKLGVADYDVRPGRSEIHRRHLVMHKVPVVWDALPDIVGSAV